MIASILSNILDDDGLISFNWSPCHLQTVFVIILLNKSHISMARIIIVSETFQEKEVTVFSRIEKKTKTHIKIGGNSSNMPTSHI